MNTLLEQLILCIEKGRINSSSNHPVEMVGMDGAIELAQKAINSGISANQLLNDALMIGMKNIGVKFKENRVFLPEVLISAKAMKSCMEILQPYFVSGEIQHKGKVLLGTVSGDLHDIGKNIVKMILEGGGWEVLDLGVNVTPVKFVEAVNQHSVKIVGLSALLTTTMQNMGSIVKSLKEECKDICIIIGGAPVTKTFADSIFADEYFSDPQGMLDFINKKFASVL